MQLLLAIGAVCSLVCVQRGSPVMQPLASVGHAPSEACAKSFSGHTSPCSTPIKSCPLFTARVQPLHLEPHAAPW